jgi:hypothetical protein
MIVTGVPSMAEEVTYETLQNGKIRQIKTFTRPDGSEITEKTTFRLSEAEAQLATQISSLEAQRDLYNDQITELQKKRDDLLALRS